MFPLQNIVFPDVEICDEINLYVGLEAHVFLNETGDGLEFQKDSAANFATYFNLFSVEKWAQNCALDGLFLALCGEGEFALKVTLTHGDLTQQVIAHRHIELEPSREMLTDLSSTLGRDTGGIITFSLKSKGNGSLSGGRFLTKKSRETLPSLAICLTTFEREKQITATMDRLEAFLDEFGHPGKIHVFVVDNGRSLEPAKNQAITVLPNPNLGGAGGFARGLIEAENAGMSHCLFMDDDAGFHLENIRRTYAFLTLAHDTRTAVAGAMISNARKTRMWENGATFNRTCHPLANATDLTDFNSVVGMEMRACARKPPHFYGGWWFFAFPVAQAQRYPFPFFVRGDDINFSLANDFAIQTLSGVVSFQDDFAEKENARTLYLDLRNHLVQHLTVESLEIGAVGCVRLALWFILRNATMFRYETCEALLLAWQDVMKGPAFFVDNIDMRVRGETLKAMVTDERPRPLAELRMPQRRRLPRMFTDTRMGAIIGKYTLNGHLIPFFGLMANHVVTSTTEQGLFRHIWGASRISYIDASRQGGYSVALARGRFLRLMWRSLETGIRFIALYRKLRLAYGQEYVGMTSKGWWQDALKNAPHSGQ